MNNNDLHHNSNIAQQYATEVQIEKLFDFQEVLIASVTQVTYRIGRKEELGNAMLI